MKKYAISALLLGSALLLTACGNDTPGQEENSAATESITSAQTTDVTPTVAGTTTGEAASTTAATSKAVKAAYDKANSAVSTVKQDGVTGATVNRFGTCSIAAATAAKTVSITTGTFALEAGAKVTVKFTNANSANSPTLNVNGTGAKNIFHNGAQITSGVNKGLLAGVCDFVYDGTQWHLVGNYHDTTYSAATTSANGLMSSTDKSKLNGIEAGADVTQITYYDDKDHEIGQQGADNISIVFNNATIANSADPIGAMVTIDDATTSQKGIVALNSATNSTSTTTAATPSAVKSAYDLASAAMPKSGGTFTGAVTLNADPTANLGAATKQYVDTQITSKIAASDAMVFKGTLGTGGTVTAVPTSNVTKGDTYKIITAGTWAGYSGCKVGDLLIAMTTGASVTANTTNWAYVPSGDESTTSIKYSTTTQSLTTSAQTGAITVGEAATKQVDTSISAGSTSIKLPTSQAVATFVEGKGYITSSGTANKANTLTTPRTIAVGGSATSTATSFDGSQNITIPLTGVDTNILYQTAGNVLIIDGNFT